MSDLTPPLSEQRGTLITDEMVEKAARAQWDALRDRVGVDKYALEAFDRLEPGRQADWRSETRAGLEAVEGDIIEAFGASGGKPCTRCMGRGWTTQYESWGHTSSGSATQRRCEECDGSGFCK